jgi:hypothetical protein
MTIRDFEHFWIRNPEEHKTIRAMLRTQIKDLFELIGIDELALTKEENGLRTALFQVGAAIPRKEARDMATTIVNVGIVLEKNTGSKSIYLSHALMGAYYQAIFEANSLRSKSMRLGNRSKARALFDECVSLLVSIFNFCRK